jgi:hypothetical protein
MADYISVYRFAETQFGFPELGLHVMWPEDKVVGHDDVPALNKRNRGRHEPGDGNYRNRWVMAKGVETQEGPLLSFEGEFSYDQGSSFLHPIHQYVQWNSARFFRAWVECRRSTPGYNFPWWMCWVVADFSFDGTIRYSSRQFNAGGSGHYNQSGFRIPLGPESEMSEGGAVAAMRSLIGSARTYPGATLRTNISGLKRYTSCTLKPPTLKFSSEMDGFEDRVDLLPHFGLDGVMADAFTQAVDGLPNLDTMNNIANGIEMLGLLKSALGMFINPTDLKSLGEVGDAWLGYRYSYCTTKADLEEAVSYCNRISTLADANCIRSNGTSSVGEWLVKCSIELETKAFAGLRSTMEKYGVALTAYNMWDMVPYSFIVDWFLDVGGLLETYTSRNIALKVKNRGAWFSVERRWTNEYGFKEVFYYRYFTTPNLAWCQRSSHGTKAVTWLKRSLDVLALFF